MTCDAHVHMGYYPRKNQGSLFYYSPRRIVGVLNRCGVSEFIVSSTCAQMAGIGLKEILREAREIKRLAGKRAHVFMWMSGHLFDEDPKLTWLEDRLIEGFKFHELETPWVTKRRRDLNRILSIASERKMPVMFHGGCSDGCRVDELARFVRKYPDVRFDIAHCPDLDDMARLVRDFPNVYTDVACLCPPNMSRIGDYDWRERLLFGTDLPVWQMKETCSLTRRYRRCLELWRLSGLGMGAFHSFVGGNAR